MLLNIDNLHQYLQLFEIYLGVLKQKIDFYFIFSVTGFLGQGF